jgi:uncharacterized protein (DUF488 family)
MAPDDRTGQAAAAVYTLGYGARSTAEFLGLLAAHEIAYLVDVRSTPYSRFKPEFSKDVLARTLQEHGIRYLYMGKQLGGMPDDPACYVDGKVDYAAVKRIPAYAEGLDRLERAWRQGLRLVLMCSEGKPELCHRSKLLGQSLVERGIPVLHIDENDRVLTQDQVITRLTGGQMGLFGEPDFTSRKRHAPEEPDDDD